MSDHAAAPAAPKKKMNLALLVLPLVAAGAGAAVPLMVDVPALLGTKPKEEDPDAKKKKHAKHEHTACLPVGDVTANVGDERSARFLRIKVAVQCEHTAEAKVKEHLEKNKAALKSWMVGNLSGRPLAEVKGPAAIARLQREVMERFDDMLYPEGESPLRAVLVEEYVIQ